MGATSALGGAAEAPSSGPPRPPLPPPPSRAARDHSAAYLAASAGAAAINYPLWRASAIGQSGFQVGNAAASVALPLRGPVVVFAIPPSLGAFYHAFSPPYKGAVATVLGMTWARAAIFYGSDTGKAWLMQAHQMPLGLPRIDPTIATLLPPLVVSTLVQCVNMPIVRATITIQDPACRIASVPAAVQHIYAQHGLRGLWHGTSAGILKSVPKYCTAIYVKDYMEQWLPSAPAPADRPDDNHFYSTFYTPLIRSAIKSTAAGIAGAALTNPLDVIRNEMFKTNLGLWDTVRFLYRSSSDGDSRSASNGGSGGSLRFLARGLGKNLIAVSVPVACTIFLTDVLIQWDVFSSSR